MFPTLSSLVNYLLGTDFSWPIPTFGFFVALSFVLSYLIFRCEFVRKERVGDIKPFVTKTNNSPLENVFQLLVYVISGFVIGYKLVGFCLAFNLYKHDPFQYLLSTDGNWVGGIITAILFAIAYLVIDQRSKRESATKNEILTSPKELMPQLVLWAAVTGFIGAKFFNLFENDHLYHSHSIWEVLGFSGLTFWGGLVFGAASYLFIGIRKGINWKHLADIGSLGMLVAYGVGRMGCHFSGDGDWGIVALTDKPFSWLPDWMWSYTFPHNVINQGKIIEGCTGQYCHELIEGVYPTSFYEFTFILAAFVILWMVRQRIKIPGLLFTIYLFIIGIERLLIEYIRINYKYDLFGFSLSEAQIVSVCLVIIGIIMSCHLIIRNSNKA